MPEPVHIHIIDPAPDALATARARWEEAPAGADHRLTSDVSIDSLAGSPTLAIIATSSGVRLQVLRETLERSQPRHLVLEKFLFPGLDDYRTAAELVADAGCRAWVNTARRQWPSYAELREQLDTTGPVSLRVTAQPAHGLGSNAVHFLDLLTYLTGRPSGDLDGALLRPVPNQRRANSIEFEGSVHGYNADGDHFAFTVLPSRAPLLLELTTSTQHVVIDEAGGTIRSASAASDWSWDAAPFQVAFQSQLTGDIATSLGEHGTCGLPSLEDASISHTSLLRAFLSSYRRHIDEGADRCPVT